MTHVGSFEAKTHLPQLLARVAQGERILITNRGKPIAMLVPPEVATPRPAEEVARDMLAYRDQVKRKLGGSFRELAHDDHKY